MHPRFMKVCWITCESRGRKGWSGAPFRLTSIHGGELELRGILRKTSSIPFGVVGRFCSPITSPTPDPLLVVLAGDRGFETLLTAAKRLCKAIETAEKGRKQGRLMLLVSIWTEKRCFSICVRAAKQKNTYSRIFPSCRSRS
jgi:hypothetical protein